MILLSDRIFVSLSFVVLCCCYLSGGSSSNSSGDVRDVAQGIDLDEEAVRLWQENFSRLKKLVGSAIKFVSPMLLSSASSDKLNVSSSCRRAMFQFISDLKAMKPWAIRVLDASSKSMSGILTGTLASFGSFDECVNTIGPLDRKGMPMFHGQYCTVQAWPPLPPKPRYYALNQRLKAFRRFENDTGMMGEFTKYVQLFYMLPFRLGICVPSSCSPGDITSITNLALNNVLPYKIDVPRCTIKEETVIEGYQIPMLCACAFLGCLILLGSLIDVLYVRRKIASDQKPQDPGLAVKCLVAFSLPSNMEKILDTDSVTDSLNVLHGIRFYSICWIILGHTYFHLNFNMLENLEITIKLSSQMSFSVVTNALLVVENFFFISGLLMVYVTMDIAKKMGRMPSPLYFILHRIWRFLPIQMLFVGVATLLPLFGTGPIWHENIDPMVNACRSDWWTNLIFVNNLYRSGQAGCVSHAWYLAADFQLYLFCIPILLIIVKRPKLGLYINFAVIVASIWAVGLYTYFRDLPPTMLFTRADVEQRTQLMREIYYPPYQHLASFGIGIFVGYFLQKHEGPLKLHWALKSAAWILAIAFTSLSLFGVHTWNKGTETGVIPIVLYASLSRVAWTLGLAWLVIACSKECGGPITRCLRYKALIPLSRLTFLAYMVHPFIQHVFYLNLRGAVQAQNYISTFMCFAFIVSSYGIGFILCLIIESPFISLGKLILDSKKASAKANCVDNEIPNVGNMEKTCKDLQQNGIHHDTKIKNSFHDLNSNCKFNQREGYTNSSFVCHL